MSNSTIHVTLCFVQFENCFSIFQASLCVFFLFCEKYSDDPLEQERKTNNISDPDFSLKYFVAYYINNMFCRSMVSQGPNFSVRN